MADAFIEYCFREFVKEIGEIVTEHYDTNLNFRSPSVEYSTGGKYWKVFKNYNKDDSALRGSTVIGFVRKEDGAILAASSWKSPQLRTKQPVKGYVTNEDRLQTLKQYHTFG
tara:strand:+ start:1347 stop:1682 length:336 start_codon:yes stop_codon:yes gene_type:complete